MKKNTRFFPALFVLLLTWTAVLNGQGVHQFLSSGNGTLSITGTDNIFGINAGTYGQNSTLTLSGKPDALNGNARIWLNRSYNEMSATVNFNLLRPTQTLILRAATSWGLGLEGNNRFVLFRKFQTVPNGLFTTQRIISVDPESPYTVVIGNGATSTPNPVLAVEDYVSTGLDGIARFRDQGTTQVGIYDATQSYQLIVSGDAYATGIWNTSDKKLKQSVRPLGTSLENIKQLKTYAYQFKKEKSYEHLGLPEELQFGLIAQELETVYPNLVRTFDSRRESSGEIEPVKSINYTGLIPVLIDGIQEQQELIEAKIRETALLKEQLADQQRQIDELRAMVEQLLAPDQEEDQSYILPLERKAMLSQNQPNPFDQNTLVHYYVPENIKDAKIRVSSTSGEVLGLLEIAPGGEGQVTIEASTYAAGTYYYSLVLDGRVVETKRMVLTR